ncbi:response regulator [Vibrio sp. FNV 38]|nr:response regulator [Vibrio sp. FNV 38]
MLNTHPSVSPQPANEPVTKKSIMLVDDDPIFRQVTKQFLVVKGYDVIEAENGLDGLQKLNGSDPDLILCDLSMPILDGIEFVEEVTQQYPAIPIIVVSATDEMSDVAKALRFGIKDFLPKPISNYLHLSDAVETAINETDTILTDGKDFSSQWYRVDGGGELPEEQELHWHLEYLQQNPVAARDLLHALLPEKEAVQGNWRCNYRLLQSTDAMPLVFDYAWLMNGQFIFYIVDSGNEDFDSDHASSVATTILVRALFHDYLRHLKDFSADLKDMMAVIERGIECSEGAGPVPAIFGLADLPSGTVDILPAGLGCRWSSDEFKQIICEGERLGSQSLKNFITRDLPINRAGRLLLSITGTTSFALDIQEREV